MNNTVNNRSNGVEYSEYYRNLRKEVSEQNAKTSQSPQKLFDGEKRTGDKVEFNTVQAASEAKIFDEKDAQNLLLMLSGAIRQDPSGAYSAQGNVSASRIAALLES